MPQQGEHIGRGIIDKDFTVPSMLLESANVYRSQCVCTVDADLIGSQSYHGAISLMESKESTDCGTSPSFGPDP